MVSHVSLITNHKSQICASAGLPVFDLTGNYEVMNVGQELRYVTAGGWSELSDIPLDEASLQVKLASGMTIS